MQITYFDDARITEKLLKKHEAKLLKYRQLIKDLHLVPIETTPEYALFSGGNETDLAAVYALGKQFKAVKHVILIGIGGSSLATEAIHSVLATEQSPTLHILDTVAAHEVEAVMNSLKGVKNVKQIAVCIVSKSGTTTEVLTNAEIVLALLVERFGAKIYKQTVCISNPGTSLLIKVKRLGIMTMTVPEMVEGRYSAFTTSTLAPLMLLQHDIEGFLAGADDVMSSTHEAVVADSAARLCAYMSLGFSDLNFFAFDTRLVRLGKWYRQLLAESIGKEITKNGQRTRYSLLPTISTPVELHSVGQLYFSGVQAVYTDFVTFDDAVHDYKLPKKTVLAGHLKGKSLQEISTAIYGGVVTAYQERQLAYRSTIFDEALPYSLGLFMGMRMLETMYLAKLLDVDAFDQPNVELYKSHVHSILGK